MRIGSPPPPSFRAKIAQFESKGGVPIPRAGSSFGISVPAPKQPGSSYTGGMMYGNIMKPVWFPSAPAFKESKTILGVDKVPHARKASTTHEPPARTTSQQLPSPPDSPATSDSRPASLRCVTPLIIEPECDETERIDSQLDPNSIVAECPTNASDEREQTPSIQEELNLCVEWLDDNCWQMLPLPPTPDYGLTLFTLDRGPSPILVSESPKEFDFSVSGFAGDTPIPQVPEDDSPDVLAVLVPGPEADTSNSMADADDLGPSSPSLPSSPTTPGSESDSHSDASDAEIQYAAIALAAPPPSTRFFERGTQTFSAVVHARLRDEQPASNGLEAEKHLPPAPSPLSPGFPAELRALVQESAVLERKLLAGELPTDVSNRLSCHVVDMTVSLPAHRTTLTPEMVRRVTPWAYAEVEEVVKLKSKHFFRMPSILRRRKVQL